MDNSVKSAGEYWSSRSSSAETIKPKSSAWYISEKFVQYANFKASGVLSSKYGDGFFQLISRELTKTKANLGISIGGGDGKKEMRLIQDGFVDKFEIYEASEVRIAQGKELAAKLGISSEVTFHLVSGNEFPKERKYDLVYWDSALHHMPNVIEALAWSKEILNENGLLAVNEYVGPNRFQWSQASLLVCDDFRKALPERFFISSDGRKLSRQTPRINVQQLIKQDPTEAQDSERIIEAISSIFPKAKISPIGGAFYHIGLRGILQNFLYPEDYHYLDIALILDSLLENNGDYHFSVAIYRK